MLDENISNSVNTSIETITETTAQTEPEGPAELLSLLSLIFGLSGIALALADIVAIIVFHSGAFALPSWTPQALRLAPPLGIFLAAAGVGLNLIGVWYLLAGHHVFDPKETAQDLAIDDVSALLARIHPGCAMRIATPAGLTAAMLATLLSIWAAPSGDYLRVIGNNSAHACSASGTLAPFSIVLDNSASTIAISWSATPVETLPDGSSWAQISPSKGRLEAGQDQHVGVFPSVLVCDAAVATAGTAPHSTGALAAWAIALASATYHVRVTTSGTSTSQSTLAMPVQQSSLTASGSPAPTATATNTPKSRPTATAVAVPTPTRVVVVPTATATPVPPTATPCPALAASITAPSNGQTFFTNSTSNPVPVSFVGSISGACGAIPASDITWSVTNSQFFPTPTVMGNGESISFTLQGTLLNPAPPYNISFQVFDPTSGQTTTASISIFVIVQLT